MSQKWLSSNFYYVLMTPGHVEFLNKYINTLLIGLECASDFALKNIRKGYTWDDIRTAVDNIINHLDKKIFLEMSIILDLPFRNKDDLRTNYRRILEVKERLEDAGFRIGVHMNILSLFPNLELLVEKPSFSRSQTETGTWTTLLGKTI